jgi:Tfp pilus assembly PilM family ATPase
VGKIFLSGGGSLFTGLKDKVATLLGIEVEYWDPLKNIKPAAALDAEKIKTIFAQLPVAVGLALRK